MSAKAVTLLTGAVRRTNKIHDHNTR